MLRYLTQALVLVVVMTMAMPAFSKDGLQKVSRQLLASLKVDQFEFAQEVKLFGQPALTAVFAQDQALSRFIQQIQDGNTAFTYADVMNEHVFLQADLIHAHAVLHLFAISENSFGGELNLIGKSHAAGLSPSSFNELMATRFLSWIPAGAQLLLDIELPGRENVLQQIYQLEQSVQETWHYINARLLGMHWVPGKDTSLAMDYWHKGNESLYVFVQPLASGTGVYLMKNSKQGAQ